MAFKPGKSGNPKGRPKGAQNKRTQLAKLLEPYAEALVGKAVEMALSGDAASLRLCIERLIPKAASESLCIELPKNATHNNMTVIKNEILTATLDGRITPHHAEKVLAIISTNYGQNTDLNDFRTLPKNPVEASKIYQQVMLRK